jgi:NAD(P)-dependent dehydrogenase (short-subunit alcohol dehydrogenase family)
MGLLDGKVALVTGTSRGIGKAIAELFCEEGARVACVARTLEEGTHPLAGSLATTIADIEAAGGEATGIAADISQFDECRRVVETTRSSYGPIDVLVNNAALTYFIPVAQFPENRWMRSFAVNFHAPFFLSRLALEDMIPRKTGAIVNISSGAAIGPGRGPYEQPTMGGGTLYGAEKAALERFTQGLASEVYADGISVTCVSPSQIVPTPGAVHHNLVKPEGDPHAEPALLMARAALLLATEPLDKVTGRVTYSQQILREFAWIDDGRGLGIDIDGSGYSKI